MEGYKPMAVGLGGGFSFGSAAASTSYTGGLFGSSSPAPILYSSIAPTGSVRYRPSTSHLYRGRAGSYPYATGLSAPIPLPAPESEKK